MTNIPPGFSRVFIMYAISKIRGKLGGANGNCKYEYTIALVSFTTAPVLNRRYTIVVLFCGEIMRLCFPVVSMLV